MEAKMTTLLETNHMMLIMIDEGSSFVCGIIADLEAVKRVDIIL